MVLRSLVAAVISMVVLSGTALAGPIHSLVYQPFSGPGIPASAVVGTIQQTDIDEATVIVDLVEDYGGLYEAVVFFLNRTVAYTYTITGEGDFVYEGAGYTFSGPLGVATPRGIVFADLRKGSALELIFSGAGVDATDLSTMFVFSGSAMGGVQHWTGSGSRTFLSLVGVETTSAVPIPPSLALLGFALAWLGYTAKRRT